VLNENFTVTVGSNPSGILYLNETALLVSQTTGGIYLYTLIYSGLSYTYQVYSSNNIVALTMLPSNSIVPAANGMFVNSNNNNVYSFTYVRGVITVTSTVVNFGTVPPQCIFTNNANFTKLIVAGAQSMELYGYCTASACASGQCDINGNCIGGCTISDPPRSGVNCACPSGYFDDSVNAQCAVAYNSVNGAYS
jgi:hypothetical protein